MSKKAKLADIIKCCEHRFERGTAKQWKHSDFGDLSQEILRDTGIAISAHTLKRIFGKITVDADYLPQQATVEALTQYGRYSLPESSLEKSTIANEIELLPAHDTPIAEKKNSRPWLLYIVILFVVIVCSVLLMLGRLQSEKDLSGSIKQTGQEGLLPATVFFALRLPHNNDSLFVDFGDKSGLVYVSQGKARLTHLYLLPGVFKVILQTSKGPLATTNVAIQSQGWMGLGYHRQRDLPEHYYAFPVEKTAKDSLFHIPNSQLQQTGLDTAGSIYTRLCNFVPVNYTSEDFTFEATFKNEHPLKGIYCNTMQFQVSGMEGMIRFKLAGHGCSSLILNIVSEQVFSGNKTNLANFTADLSKWNTARLINRNKHLILYLNDILLFEGDYQKPIGNIKGLFLEFQGNGYVKTCNLWARDGKPIYQF